MSVLVVTGTDTGVGKTMLTAALTTLAAARGSSVAVVKPAQTGVAPGEPGDLDEITRLAAAGTPFEYARYPDPLSPAAAARLVLVEGTGGLLVRYDEDGATIADLARMLRAPVLVVVRAGLGTLNHTALTLEALAHHGIPLAGLVIGAWPAEPDLARRCNIRDLETLGARPLSGVLPERAAALQPAEFLAAARAGLAPALGGTFDAADFRRAHQP
jgi:dethiobiotin synthetase